MMIQNKTKDHVSKQAPLVYIKVYHILYTTVTLEPIQHTMV